MNMILAIAGGGALGALGRYWTAAAVQRALGGQFPWGTLSVNVIGSLLMGLLFVLLTERMNVGPQARGVVLVGFLGAFTTFSTFSLETLLLVEQGAVLRALANVGLSVLICVVAAWLGMAIGRQL
ncbi:MAG: fluoride efflux transporter CrcB [Gammaproteobacteria bacterium]|jgi:CrcB protein